MKLLNIQNIRYSGQNQNTLNVIAFKGKVNQQLNEDDVLDIFKDEITPIYRPSGNCTQISNYFATQLQKEGFKVYQQADGAGKGNIVAERNVVNNNATVLQAHMDMVYVTKRKEKVQEEIRQGKRPAVELLEQGHFLMAKKTSLGADDGIGLAMALGVARIKDPEIRKLPLQIIFTVDEETGLIGAEDLPEKCIKGKNVINLDINSLGKIIVGCAGIKDYRVSKELGNKDIVNLENHPLAKDCELKEYTFSVSGFKGGHSALDINKGIQNPIKVVFDSIAPVENYVILKAINAGTSLAKIPTRTDMKMFLPEEYADIIIQEIKSNLEEIKSKLPSRNSNLCFSIKPTGKSPKKNLEVISPEYQQKLIKVITDEELKTGTIHLKEYCIKPITSQNIGRLGLDGNKLTIGVRLRSNNEKDFKQVAKNIEKAISELTGEDVKPDNVIPVWSSKRNDLTALAIDAYKNAGVVPVLSETHGTIEAAQLQHLGNGFTPNIIGVGPTVKSLHSLQERLSVDTLKPACMFLETLISKLSASSESEESEELALLAVV